MREVRLDLAEKEDRLPDRVVRELGLPPSSLRSLRVVRRGIDARNRRHIVQVFTVEFEVDDPPAVLAANRENHRLEAVVEAAPPPPLILAKPHRSLVVGMGPAGLFAALKLARAGASVTLLERGRAVEQRVRDVRRFWRGEGLDPESNVQFGEGGAGTFSDGKLTTRVNHPLTREVLETLVEFGAPPEILVQARPHIGTDRLRLVLIRYRQALQRLGVDLRFGTRLDDLEVARGRIVAGVAADGDRFPCDSLVLAPGHSSRDTYRMLESRGVRLEAKAFAIGLRVEHPAEIVNRLQYGVSSHPRLPAAEYALTWNDPDSGRGVYSFCMCPGGEVVLASSEPGGVAVNGMSRSRRDGPFSNSALVVAVRPSDFPGSDPLAGVRFQRHWEAEAYAAGGGDYHAPAQNLIAFLGRGNGPLVSTCRPGIREADLAGVLPGFVCDGLRRALPHFDRRLRGFVTAEATLVGIESRTSAPLRILRGEDGQSPSHRGLYPVGEGAGYAGGIMSAAIDGLKAAALIVQNVTNGSHE